MTDQHPVVAAEDLRHRRLRRLLQYWQARRRGDALPARADIDPLQIPWILGDLSLVEVHHADSGLRFRFRLIGSMVARRFGFDATGTWLDDFPGPDYRRHVAVAFTEVVHAGLPFVERPNMVIDERLHDYEVLRLPLAGDGRAVDMLMVAVDFGAE